MHYGYNDLEWLDLGGTGWKRASVTLEAGDSASQPGSTKHAIHGPAVVTFEQAPDGGISAHVER